MMERILKYKGFLVLIIILAAVIGGYVYVVGSGQDSSLLVPSGGVSRGATVERELLVLLQTLRSVELSDEIFSDSSFLYLVDFSQELIPEPIGRDNPFAPITTSSSN